ncbi:MAG: hypothetical protein KatS3mg053_0357 [Candidatus Roseilinea sp.]|nr:MAG: hypothetical protein KatS3mg053_0357 [Candidatus Roseilinea sp.]
MKRNTLCALRFTLSVYPSLIFVAYRCGTMNTANTAPAFEADVAFDCPGNYQAATPSTLRCSKCNRPLAVKDAQRTPTGYVCPYYVKARVATFYTAGPKQYILAALVAFVLGIGIGFVLQFVGRIGFFALILTIFVGPAAGGLVAEAIRRVNGKDRGQYVWLVAAIAMVIGAAYFTVLPALFALLAGSPGFIFALIPIVGLAIAVTTLVARLRF